MLSAYGITCKTGQKAQPVLWVCVYLLTVFVMQKPKFTSYANAENTRAHPTMCVHNRTVAVSVQTGS